jgi:hypothetical protein
MKISARSFIVCLLALACLFGAGMLTGHRMTEAGVWGGRSAGPPRTGFSAIARFRIPPPVSEEPRVGADFWLQPQLEALTSGAVLDRVVKSLKLEAEWGLAASDAVIQLRNMIDVGHERGTDLVSLTVWNPAAEKAETLAYAVVEAYAAIRDERHDELARRLTQSISPPFTAQVAAVEKARLEMNRFAEKYSLTASVPPTGRKAAGGDGQEYRQAKSNYESQVQLLNDMREKAMRVAVEASAVQKPVEILELSKSAFGR